MGLLNKNKNFIVGKPFSVT